MRCPAATKIDLFLTGVGSWNRRLAIRSKSPFSGRPEFASGKTIARFRGTINVFCPRLAIRFATLARSALSFCFGTLPYHLRSPLYLGKDFNPSC
jgi:hypothetical protein